MSNHLKNYKKIRVINDNKGSVGLYVDNNMYVIYRYATRGRIENFVSKYELVDNSISYQLPIDIDIGNKILDRLANGENFSDAFIFYKSKSTNVELPKDHSNLEHQYTSTGIKFWRHQEQMWNYRNGDPNTIISTHISPEGACNLKCSYCSVTYRDTHSRIP